MTYGEFMDKIYIPYYKTEVEESTFNVKEGILEKIRDRFSSIPLRSISVENVQNFRTWLLSTICGRIFQIICKLFSCLCKSLDKAVEMQYLEHNIAKNVKAIQKGKAIVPYWTKQEFEKVINQIYIGDFYEHLNFVMLWVYYMTGIRVNEGTALYWNNVYLTKKRLTIHHMLIIKNKTEWKRNSYTKTEDGKRIIALDDDTIKILKEWRIKTEGNWVRWRRRFCFYL